MSFSAEGSGSLVQAWSLLKMHLNLVNLILQVLQGLLEKIKQVVKSDTKKNIFYQIEDMVGISKASVLPILQIFWNWRREVLGAAFAHRGAKTHPYKKGGVQTYEKVSKIQSENNYECSDRLWDLDTFLWTTPKN